MKSSSRHPIKRINRSLTKTPVTAILGARQTGKTTLAKTVIAQHKDAIYIDLEKPSDKEMLNAPELFFKTYNNRLICLDEIQLLPEIFSVMRSIIDDQSYNIKFLITGSASPRLLQKSSESLAGRIAFFELPPFLIKELDNNFDLNNYITRGGFPLSLLAGNDADSFEWRENFIVTFLERDLRSFGYNIPQEILSRLWKMIAHYNGQILNYSSFAKAMGISDTTTRRYIDILQNTFMLRVLQPYHPNIKKRLTKSPKLYVRDVGITNALLNIRTFEDLFSHPVYGSVWESICIENIIQTQRKWEPFYYHTASGNELDLVLTKSGKTIAFEFKASSTPKVSRGFWEAIKDVEASKTYIIAPVERPYPYAENVWVYPIKDFLKLESII